jgi:hypothetical protein
MCNRWLLLAISSACREVDRARRSRVAAELSARTFCTFKSEFSSLGELLTRRKQVFRCLSDVRGPLMIIAMTTTGRHQRRYDHRLRDVVQRTGDVTIATDLGVPPSTARGWLRKTPNVVISLDVTNRSTWELEQEILELRRRVRKLTALLRLALALLRSSEFTLTHDRLPDGRAKVRILRAVECARAFVPLQTVLRFLRLSPSRFHAWQRFSTHVRSTTSRPVRTRHPIDSRQLRSARSRTW